MFKNMERGPSEETTKEEVSLGEESLDVETPTDSGKKSTKEVSEEKTAEKEKLLVLSEDFKERVREAYESADTLPKINELLGLKDFNPYVLSRYLEPGRDWGLDSNILSEALKNVEGQGEGELKEKAEKAAKAKELYKEMTEIKNGVINFSGNFERQVLDFFRDSQDFESIQNDLKDKKPEEASFLLRSLEDNSHLNVKPEEVVKVLKNVKGLDELKEKAEKAAKKSEIYAEWSKIHEEFLGKQELSE